jgi:hypothetical protein
MFGNYMGQNHSQNKNKVEEKPKTFDGYLADFKYPHSIEVRLKNVGGRTVTKRLIGKEAEKWFSWIRKLCEDAEENGTNPDWNSLDWEITW